MDSPTLNRFYSFHFLFPFVLSFLVILHLFYLHEEGSSNPLGVYSNYDKIIFHVLFSLKDLLGGFVRIIILFAICSYDPWVLGDSENFIPANPLVTPVHIQPE